MKTLLIDSSLLISLFREEEIFHANSNALMALIIACKNNARILIPSVVFFETIFKLHQKGIPQEKTREILLDLTLKDQVFTVNMSELTSFRLFKKFPKDKLGGFKTSDFIILCNALAFDAYLLTYDKKLRRNAGAIYDKIYYCDPDDKEFGEDTLNFLTTLTKP